MLPVLDNLTVGLLFVDEHARVIDANRAALHLLDAPREAVVGALASALGVRPADELPQLLRVLPAGQSERFIECRARPARGTPGVAWTCELADVTAEREAATAHRRTERRLKNLVANLPGAVYRCANDRDWTMEFISEGVLALTGWPPSAFTDGRVTYASLIVEADRDAVFQAVQAALQKQQPFSLRYRMRTADGRLRWVFEQGAGIFDDDERLVALEGFVTDVTAVHGSEERYRAMFERNQAIKWILDPTDGRIVDVNEAAARFYGYTKEQLLRMRISDINTNPPDRVRENMAEAAKQERVSFEFKHKKASGEIVDVEVQSGPIELDGRTFLFSIVHDISEKKRLEEALRHAQKMEAVGRLAGGVAHDFNNLMTVIVGATSLVLRDLPESSPHRQRVVEIAEAGKRAARLTRQLLAVGRRQLLAPEVMDLNERLAQMKGMLRDTLPANIELVLDAQAKPPWVEADPDQLEQVVLNLAINGRDAMPAGGVLTIRTRNLTVARREPAVLDVPPGDYVVLDVADTGVGIEPLGLRHIFEPFYSTKPDHAGSGLGLATVYGIVKQSGGNVAVESAPGKGATFRVALPAAQPRVPVDEPPLATPPAARAAARLQELQEHRAGETVLVVDDDELVRRLTALMLEALGYRVLVARDGEHALQIAAEHAGPIHLVLTDVMMPRLAGGALVEKLLPIRPDLRVLFVSGYVDEVAAPAPAPSRTAFLQKPVTPEALATKIRGLLDA